MAFAFAFGCAPLCWLCSVVCGLFAIQWKDTAFPKLERASFVLLGLSTLSFVASWVILDSMLDDIVRMIAGVVYVSGAMWCLVSLCTTLFVIIQDAKKLNAWIIFIVQILWATTSLFFFFLSAAIAAAC